MSSFVGSKITPPSPFFLEFFYIFSSVILVLSWLILPLILYIVLTQSKNLKILKWTILNHLIWCLLLETVLGIVKPVLLTPAFAGFHLGPFRYIFGNGATGITGGICCAMISSCIFALCATLASRYLLIFPSKLKDWFTVKKFLYIGVLLPLLFYLLFGITVYLSGKEPLSLNFKRAIEYDPILENYIKTEPTFTFVPYVFHYQIDVIVLAFFAGIFIASVTIILLICHQFTTHKTVILTKFHKSLILISFIQIVITCVFLFLPVIFFVTVIYFNIPHTANLMTFMLCLLISHCFIEFIATLYFIHPYYIFIVKIFNTKIGQKNCFC